MNNTIIRPVARGGGRGGRTTPPVAHPKDFVPPFSNFVPPFSNFVPPFSNFVPPFSNFVPPFSNFVPPLEYVDDVTRAMSKGGGCLWMSKSGGVFQIDEQCPRGGGCAWCSTHPSSDPPPHLAGWLRAWSSTYTRTRQHILRLESRVNSD